jgi:hypothetical protein
MLLPTFLPTGNLIFCHCCFRFLRAHELNIISSCGCTKLDDLICKANMPKVFNNFSKNLNYFHKIAFGLFT